VYFVQLFAGRHTVTRKLSVSLCAFFLSVIDSNGELTEIVISFIDITEMKLMQKEVIKAKYFAEKSK
jgi:hypothetical protein